jgi:phosphatidylglycerophosphatase A
VAPGTAGTLAALPLAWAVNKLPLPLHLAALLASLPAAAWICGRAAADSGQEDPGWITLDEMLGFLVATFRVPASVGVYGAAFVLFRLFDILKPPPAGWADRQLAGGWGILLDDIFAGLFARLAVLGLTWLGVPGL